MPHFVREPHSKKWHINYGGQQCACGLMRYGCRKYVSLERKEYPSPKQMSKECLKAFCDQTDWVIAIRDKITPDDQKGKSMLNDVEQIVEKCYSAILSYFVGAKPTREELMMSSSERLEQSLKKLQKIVNLTEDERHQRGIDVLTPFFTEAIGPLEKDVVRLKVECKDMSANYRDEIATLKKRIEELEGELKEAIEFDGRGVSMDLEKADEMARKMMSPPSGRKEQDDG